jgi:predicted ATPase
LDERAEQLIAVATEQGFPFWGAQGTICRGWVMVKNGDLAQGLSLLRSGSSASRATGAERPAVLLAAAACEIAGQIEEALTLLDDALQIAERTGERWFAAELNRHKGQLLLGQGHSEAAEELYRKALSIAEEQGAKLWELRAAASLARLRRDQGRRAEASRPGLWLVHRRLRYARSQKRRASMRPWAIALFEPQHLLTRNL